MKKFIWLFLVLFNCGCFHLMTEEQPKELKTLILIITTDDQPFYKEAQKIWSAYMNSDPNHFEVYFLRANPDLETPFVINKNKSDFKNGR